MKIYGGNTISFRPANERNIVAISYGTNVMPIIDEIYGYIKKPHTRFIRHIQE